MPFPPSLYMPFLLSCLGTDYEEELYLQVFRYLITGVGMAKSSYLQIIPCNYRIPSIERKERTQGYFDKSRTMGRVWSPRLLLSKKLY